MLPNYGEYSRCAVESAGEYWSGDAVAGKWAWAPNHDQPSTSSVQWGKPAVWPPLYRELFDREMHNGVDKLFLRGWYDNGTFYTMLADREYLIDDRGTHEVAPHPEGWQLYAYWDVADWTYTLDTYGRLREEASGKEVTFYHRMTWYPPKLIANRFHGQRDCIRFFEDWWDDNPARDGLLVRKVARTNYLAKGAGMAWAIRQTYPQRWEADLRDWWLWPR